MFLLSRRHQIVTTITHRRVIRLQQELELAAMVHVKVEVTGVVGVQNELLAGLRPCIKEHIDAKCEVVKENIASLALCLSIDTRAVYLHFVLALEEYTIGCSQTGGHILAAIAEEHLSRKALTAWLQSPS